MPGISVNSTCSTIRKTNGPCVARHHATLGAPSCNPRRAPNVRALGVACISHLASAARAKNCRRKPAGFAFIALLGALFIMGLFGSGDWRGIGVAFPAGHQRFSSGWPGAGCAAGSTGRIWGCWFDRIVWSCRLVVASQSFTTMVATQSSSL